MRSFGSDNHSGVHPIIMDALLSANRNHQLAYGDDSYTAEAAQLIRKYFGEQADFFPVFNGTGANICALRACTQPFNAILTAETGHIYIDECGAPEWLTGAALKSFKTPDGKVTPAMVESMLHLIGFEHHSQPKVLYISQLTELGTLYTPAEIQTLANLLHQNNIYLHMDGARIANAAATLQCSFKEMTTDVGVDILSFGGTKNGMMMGEAVITLRPELAENMKLIRKQSTQLFSKMRFASAQFIAYLADNLWLTNATHANQMAQLLRKEMSLIHPFEFTYPTQGNIIIVKMDRKKIDQLLENHFFYVWDEANNEIRLVTSWDTTPEDIELFIRDLKKIYS